MLPGCHCKYEGYDKIKIPLIFWYTVAADNGSNYFRDLDGKTVRVAFLLVVDWLRITSFLM